MTRIRLHGADIQYGQVKRLVAGDDDRAAVLAMFFQAGTQGGAGRRIKRGQRLVEQPQRWRLQPKAGELAAALLSGGELAALPVVVAVEGDGGERGIEPGFEAGAAHAVVEAGGVAQVFARSQGAFDTGAMAEVEQRRVATNLPALRGDEPGERLQQGSFAAAVVAGEVDDLPGGDGQRVVAQQQTATFKQGEVVGFEQGHGIGAICVREFYGCGRRLQGVM